MLTKLVHSFQNAKLAAIKKFSDQNYDILDEPGFLDNGYIRAKVQQLKTEYTKINHEIDLLLQYDKNDDYRQEKVSSLMEHRDYILLDLAFLSSNGFNSLEGAINMIQNIQTDFVLCLKALSSYKIGKEAEAFMQFEQYFQRHPDILEHFLINKVYGELLVKQNNADKAIGYLMKAAEKRPEDTEIHKSLMKAYRSLGNNQRAKIHEDILKLLDGENIEHR